MAKPKLKAVAPAPTLAELVDMIGDLKAKLAPLEDDLKGYTATVKAKGVGAYQGTRYDIVVFDQDRTILDSAAIRADFTAEMLAKYEKTSTARILKVTGRKTSA